RCTYHRRACRGRGWHRRGRHSRRQRCRGWHHCGGFLSPRNVSHERDVHEKHTAASEPRAQADPVAETLRNALHDREAEPRAALVRLRTGVETLKLEEDPLVMLRRDARTAVPYLDPQKPADTPASHEHSSAPAVAHRVGKVVLQDAPQQRLIRVDHRAATRDPQLDAAGTGQDAELPPERLEQRAGRKVTLMHLERAGLETGDVEQRGKNLVL